MVFSSIPAYLDPPPNWQQQQNSESSCQLLIQPPPLPGQHHTHVPDHVAAQAHQQQLAKIPPTTSSESSAALKCPRCDSTNTKFCYFNNYSLSQPRHFCKTCRRYWTRGGALRNVPVGGGCRTRNSKKTKTTTKSPPVSNSNDKEYSLSNSTSATAIHSSFINNNHDQQIGQFIQPITNRPNYINSLQNLNHRYGIGVGNIGLMGFQTAGEGGGMDHQWRFQQFPFMNGFETTSTVSYPFQSEIVETPSFRVTHQQPSSVKLEYNMSRSPLSYNSWGIDNLSAFASSSASASPHHHNLL